MRKSEIEALEEVNMAVSDYLLGLKSEAFADMWGGVGALLNDLRISHEKYEEEFNTLPDDE